MKKILFILMFSYSLTSVGQHNFIWDVTDSTTKTKNQIYSDIKLYVATKWNSAQNVIQNDDKDAGIILLKGSTSVNTTHILAEYTYVYSYTITFKMKDFKYKIILNNVHCTDAYLAAGKKMTKIDPCEEPNCPESGTFENPGPSNKKINEMMKTLNDKLYLLVIDFLQEMKTAKTKKDDW